MSGPSKLVQILGLLYRRTDEETQDLERHLLGQMKRAWSASLTEQARQAGYAGPVNPPRREDLAWLRDEARRDAQSIVGTWNRDAVRQLQKLYAANPRGNRNYYISNMERWAADREVWKGKQIAVNTEQKARTYAQERFRDVNGLRGDQYVIIGPPPVCEICVGYFAAGVVDQKFVDAHPLPAHIGCPHEWGRIGTVEAPAPAELWVG